MFCQQKKSKKIVIIREKSLKICDFLQYYGKFAKKTATDFRLNLQAEFFLKPFAEAKLVGKTCDANKKPTLNWRGFLAACFKNYFCGVRMKSSKLPHAFAGSSASTPIVTIPSAPTTIS